MARYGYLILFTLFLMGCAQVGTISGGEKDTFAPQPVEGKVVPENASTFMVQKEVRIPFDEYFRLNNPAQNIQMIPPHAKLTTRVKGKTLFINWEEDLRDNTTYAIYLNRALKDLSEGNDSIMQYVFSTGATLDSFFYSVPVVDAWSNEPVKDIVVALREPQTKEVLNFTQTDSRGMASLRYVGQSTYEVLAFKDENGDLEPQANEEIGFPDPLTINVDSSGFLTESIRLFTPSASGKITGIEFKKPTSYLVNTNRPISNETLYMDGVEVPDIWYKRISDFSLRLFFDPNMVSNGDIVLHSDEITDTISYRLLKSQIDWDVELSPSEQSRKFPPSGPITFLCNDMIASVDSALISVIDEADSTPYFPKVEWHQNEIYLDLPKNKTRTFKIRFDKRAIQTQVGYSSEVNISVTANSAKKYGSLLVNVSHYEQPIVLMLMQGEKMIRSVRIEDPQKVETLKELEPGEYTFKVILDENQNGAWDVGDFETLRQPEHVDDFLKPTKVRANWDVEVTIVPQQVSDEEPNR